MNTTNYNQHFLIKPYSLIVVKLMMITSFQAAERQFLQAIRLFLQEEDPVSVHTIISAASQVFYDIWSKSSFDKREYQFPIRRGRNLNTNQGVYRNDLFKHKIFFKHAKNNQPEETVFDPVWNEHIIFETVLFHIEWTQKALPESIAFLSWYSRQHSELDNIETVVQLTEPFLGLPTSLSLSEFYVFYLRLKQDLYLFFHPLHS